VVAESERTKRSLSGLLEPSTRTGPPGPLPPTGSVGTSITSHLHQRSGRHSIRTPPWKAIESTVSTLPLRTRGTKGRHSRSARLARADTLLCGGKDRQRSGAAPTSWPSSEPMHSLKRGWESARTERRKGRHRTGGPGRVRGLGVVLLTGRHCPGDHHAGRGHDALIRSHTVLHRPRARRDIAPIGHALWRVTPTPPWRGTLVPTDGIGGARSLVSASRRHRRRSSAPVEFAAPNGALLFDGQARPNRHGGIAGLIPSRAHRAPSQPPARARLQIL